MRIALVGTFSGWMGIHMEQMALALEQLGHTVLRIYDAKLRTGFFFRRSFEDFNRRFRRRLKSFAPDLALITMSRQYYDFAALKAEFPHTAIAVWDFDGPNWRCCQDFQLLRELDLLLTVSRITEREMRENGVNAHYLPHGVDCEYYAPRPVSPRFASPVSYIGRATPRRAELSKMLAGYGLALYGRRWLGVAPELKSCIRGKKDVIGDDVVKIYTSSTCMVNMLQGALADRHTILSLQVFAIPAAGGCLITEHTVELEESFAPGSELLAWNSPEELAEQVRFCTEHPDFARRIGTAGRERCLKAHSQTIRMRQLLDFVTR